MFASENAAAGGDMRSQLARIEEANAKVLDAVAKRMHTVIQEDGLIYAAGTGHSVAMVLETFYRAGGLACIYPVYHPALLPLEGGAVSTALERVQGLAKLLLAKADPSERDMAFVFSNSGVNPVPVELAQELREAGATVVAVVSLDHLRQAPARADSKLDQVADLVLDTLVPYGDAFFRVDGMTTAPLSSLCGVYLWNLLLVRLAALASRKGTELPLWVSANVEGGAAQNEALLLKYQARVPHL